MPRYANLSEDDEFALTELLHEIEHNFGPCPYAAVGNLSNCTMWQRAAVNSDRGYLGVIDNFVGAKVVALQSEADGMINDLFDECTRLKAELLAARTIIDAFEDKND